MIISPQGTEQLKVLRRDGGGDNSGGDDDSIAKSAGCTGNVLLITPQKFYVANAGDSRSVLSRSGKAIALSEDHKPESEVEKTRITKAGGTIANGRVNGGLNLSRSLGDFFYKSDKNLGFDEQLIISKPDVTVVDRSKQDEFIIMGCDGIW
jgi:serine/threonine protein phosphatase PrpC